MDAHVRILHASLGRLIYTICAIVDCCFAVMLLLFLIDVSLVVCEQNYVIHDIG